MEKNKMVNKKIADEDWDEDDDWDNDGDWEDDNLDDY